MGEPERSNDLPKTWNFPGLRKPPKKDPEGEPSKSPVIVCVERAKRPKLPGTRHGARCKRLTLCLKPPTTSPSSTPSSFVLRQATRAASPHGSGQRSGFRVVSLGMWLASTDSHWLSQHSLQGTPKGSGSLHPLYEGSQPPTIPFRRQGCPMLQPV